MGTRIKVGILGAGFGGLYALFYMRRYLSEDIEATLFDKNNYLLYTPVLHEMATGTVNARHVVVPIRKVISPRWVRIRCEEVIRVDLVQKSLETPSGSFPLCSVSVKSTMRDIRGGLPGSYGRPSSWPCFRDTRTDFRSRRIG